jgi:hypothetical protein
VNVTNARRFTPLEAFRERWRYPFPYRALVQTDVDDAPVVPTVAPQFDGVGHW